MKSFFQSFSFLRDKQALQSTLAKVDMGWLMSRFFVLALVAYLISTITLGIGFFAGINTVGYNWTKENVKQDVNVIGNNILSQMPKNTLFFINSTGVESNLTEALEIPVWVLYSGSSFASKVQGEVSGDNTLMLLDTISEEDGIDYTAQPITISRSMIAVYDGQKVEKRLWNQKGEEFTGTVVSYDMLSAALPTMANGIDAHRESFHRIVWIIAIIGGIIFLLLASLLISHTVFVAYIWSYITRAIASMLKKGRNYETSYAHTILATFPLFVLNRFIEIPWYIDIVMIMILVFVMDNVSQTEEKKDVSL